MILIVRYARKVKLAFIVSTISRCRIKASGGSQPRKVEGASHHARRGKNAEAFLNQKSSVYYDFSVPAFFAPFFSVSFFFMIFTARFAAYGPTIFIISSAVCISLASGISLER